jgi:hypothetical protein
MARIERAEGTNPLALALARSIETSHSAEVTELSRILQNLSPPEGGWAFAPSPRWPFPRQIPALPQAWQRT